MKGPGVPETVGWKRRAANLRPRDPIGLLTVLSIVETVVIVSTASVIMGCSL